MQRHRFKLLGPVHPCGDLYWQWRVVVRIPRKLLLEACSTGGKHITSHFKVVSYLVPQVFFTLWPNQFRFSGVPTSGTINTLTSDK